MKKEIKTTGTEFDDDETFDVDEKVAELKAAIIELMNSLNELYSSVQERHQMIVWDIKPVIDSLKNSGVDLDDDDYCPDIDRLNGCVDREITRIKSKMYYLSLPIFPMDIRKKIEFILIKLINIKELIHEIDAYYDAETE